MAHTLFCCFAIVALATQTVTGTPQLIDDTETTLCIPGSFDLGNNILDWEQSFGEDTYILEESCRVVMENLRKEVIGGHGPPSIYAIKAAMCSQECVSFNQNVKGLHVATECTCKVLDHEYPLPGDERSHMESWCDRSPSFYLSKSLDYNVNQQQFDINYCPCTTELFCASTARSSLSTSTLLLCLISILINYYQ